MKYNLDYFIKKFKYFPEKISLVVLGTTQAHFAFDFSDYNIYAANMAVFKNTLIYHKHFLKKYKRRIQKGGTVLITLQYPIFLCHLKQKRDRAMNLQYSKVLFGYDPHMSVWKQLICRLFPYRNMKEPAYQNFMHDSEKNKERNHLRLYEIDRRINNLITEGWEAETYPVKIWKYEQERQVKGRKKRLEHNIHIVKNTIYYCREKGWNPVLVGLPYSEQLNHALQEHFIRDCFYNCIKDIQSETKIPFLDYSGDTDFSSIHNYMDIWFLNEKGRKKFTKRVLRDLEERGMNVYASEKI